LDFINDIDLVAGLVGSVVDLLTEAAYIINAGITGGVNFNNIQSVAFGDGTAHGTGIAGFALAVGQAVDGFGQNAGGAGLASAARAAEEVGVGDATAAEGIAQGLRNRLLANDLSQGLGAPLAIKDLGSHRLLLYSIRGPLPKGFWGIF
jgi:hypothetical protein